MRFPKKIGLFMAAIGFLLPSFGFAVSPELAEIYEERPDLQAAFDPGTHRAIPGTASGFLIDLEDWARQYGWKSYPELEEYAPAKTPARSFTSVLPPEVTALNYIVIDNTTGEILAARNAELEWPVASLTKLVTAKTAFDYGLDYHGIGAVVDEDDVGGARLWVESGTDFYVFDLFRATLIASANNAANALARLTGLPKSTFIQEMNAFADSLNLGRTKFVDPTGIELGNISTAREIAYLAMSVFSNENIRKLTGTSWMHIEALNDPEYVRDISSTNWLLYDPAYDDVYVTAGKTGYLHESKWNLVVRMHPMGDSFDKSVLIVVMGAESRRESFDDAANLARWAWTNFDWTRSDLNVAGE